MKTVKGRRTKTRILDAAVELLVSGVAAKLSLDAVIERSQTSKGQLFYYFPGGRVELLKAATVSQLDVIAAQGTPDALLTWDDWEEWFERLATVHIAQSAEDACEVAALAGRTLDADADGRLLIGRVFDDWHRALGGWFTSMQASGLLRDDAPLDQLASLVLATIEGSAVLDKATGSTRHLGAALGQVLVLLRSYGPTTTTEHGSRQLPEPPGRVREDLLVRRTGVADHRSDQQAIAVLGDLQVEEVGEDGAVRRHRRQHVGSDERGQESRGRDDD